MSPHPYDLMNAIVLSASTQIVDHENGKDAETHVERVDYTDDMALSYVKLMPRTGR